MFQPTLPSEAESIAAGAALEPLDTQSLEVTNRLIEAVRRFDLEAAETELGELQGIAQEAGDRLPIVEKRLLRCLRAYCSIAGDVDGVVESCLRMLQSPLCGQAEAELCFLELARWGDPREAIDALAAFVARPDLPVEQRVAMIQRIVGKTDLPVADKLLPVLRTLEVEPRKRDRIRARLAEVREAQREARQQDGYRLRDEVTVALNPKPRVDATVLVFNGLQRPHWFSLEAVRDLIHPLGAHMIYLRDNQNLLFSQGIGDLGPDVASSARRLRQKVDQIGTRRLYCIGNSSGGYGAILFGCELNADAVVGFSAQTTVAENAEAFDIREPLIHGLLRLRVPPAERPRLDLLPRLEGRDPALKLFLHYGERQREDAQHAERVGHLPGVSLFPIAGFDQHGAFSELQRTGQLDDVLGNLLKLGE